ncbi:uncharacterized protein LOC117173866 [Belonocnema kinseyi]|uniref:uncharacterized protein LOC117173866 n=1 Tax=Belonocnema kinseyi TaxID=2817044 RepID=UPI00143DA999|nr:uncharacterized protein LOC117173866 [Belonocnema kinseyi]
MSEYNLLIVCFISVTGLLIKAEWVEIPAFSHDQKVYRTSLKLDRFNQFYRDERDFTSTVGYDIQNVSKYQQASEIRNTAYPKRPEYLFINNATVSSLDFSGYSQATTATVTSTENTNFEENEEPLEDYDHDEYDDEGEVHEEQINTPEISEQEEMHTTCSTDTLETKIFSNSSFQEKLNINVSEREPETDKHYLYYLPVKLLKNVHLILKSQPATLDGKIRFLKNFEKTLLIEVESRLAASMSPFTDANESKGKRKKRYDHYEDDHLGFPSLEGALMAISFLTFAVYLVRLIMLLCQNFMTVPPTAATVFFGRKKRSMDYLDEDMIRILGYLNK